MIKPGRLPDLFLLLALRAARSTGAETRLGYVLMAFAVSFVLAGVELPAPGSFFINPANNPDATVGWWDLVYFSFTCLTSVGFGEITPVSDFARSVVMIEPMSGVLFLAIVISRLISMHGARRR